MVHWICMTTVELLMGRDQNLRDQRTLESLRSFPLCCSHSYHFLFQWLQVCRQPTDSRPSCDSGDVQFCHHLFQWYCRLHFSLSPKHSSRSKWKRTQLTFVSVPACTMIHTTNEKMSLFWNLILYFPQYACLSFWLPSRNWPFKIRKILGFLLQPLWLHHNSCYWVRTM